MADLRRLHPRLVESDLEKTPFVPELTPVVDPRGDWRMTRPWLDWARRLTLLVGVKSTGGGGGEPDPTHVVGPDGATPDAVAIYNGSTGKIIKDSLTSIGSIISQAVSQAIAAILPGGTLPLTNLPLHKTTHYAAGADAVDVKLLAGYPGTATTFLNGTGGFTTPAAGVPGPHHATHEPGGADPMAVDAAPSSGSLRTLGSGANQAAPGNDARFAAPSTPTSHHTTHEPGGADVLSNAAWTNQGNVFTEDQTFQSVSPELNIIDTVAAADARLFNIFNSGQILQFRALNDAHTIALATPLVLKRNGDIEVGSNVYEKSRPTPMGHWVSQPLSSYLSGFTGSYTYSYIGKTLLLTIDGAATLGAAVASITLLLPAGVTASVGGKFPISAYIGAGWISGIAYFSSGGVSSCDLYLGSFVNWPAAAVQVSFSITIPIQ